MEIATPTGRESASELARPHPTRLLRRSLSLPAIAFVVLCVATFVGFIVYPTYPNYDSYYSLIWGREVLHGITPSFEAYRAPTEHPLAIAFGAVLSLLGTGGDRVMVFATMVSFVALAAGLYRLGRAAFGPIVGLIAAALLCSRFDFPFLALRAYIDIPYLAFIVWAAALEAEKRRRGYPVYWLLLAAALLRPEAWLIIGIYWLWTILGVDWKTRIRFTIITAAGPVIWATTDYLVTGDPMFSLTHTSGLAEELGRTSTLADIPSSTLAFLKNLDKVPVFYAGVVGAVLAVLITPRRAWMPLALLVIGIGTFFAVGIAGLSVIDRYLLVPSLMIMILAGVTVGGWSMLEKGWIRTGWMVGAAAIVVYGVVFTLGHVNFNVFVNELQFRDKAHHALQRTLDSPKLEQAMKCGPLQTPNHKLIPDTRWLLDVKVDEVLARSDPDNAGKLGAGAALLATNRSSVLRQAVVADTDKVENNLPPAGFIGPFANSDYYAIYTRCPG